MAIASIGIVYNLHLYSFFGIGFGLLNSLYLDYKMCSEGSAPKYWLSFKFKYAVWTNAIVFVLTLCILNFHEHDSFMKKMLHGYELLGRGEADKKDVQSNNLSLLVMQEKFTKLKEHKEVLDILEDPTK